MPHGIKRSNGQANPDKEKIQADISALGLELEGLQNKANEYQDCTVDIIETKKELEEIRAEQKQEVKNLKDEIILLSTIKEEAGSLKKEINNNKELIETQSDKISNNKRLLATQDKDIEDNEKKLPDLKKAVDDKKEKLSLINLESKENDKIKLEEDITKFENEISEKKTEKANLEIESNLKSQEIEGKQIEIINLETKIASLKKETGIIETENEGKKEWVKKELQGIEDGKRDEWNKKDGDLVLRESWLKEKKETLRANKIELEKFYGKKINNLII